MSTKKRKSADVYCHIDTRFDDLNVVINEHRPRRKDVSAPHCDCFDANKARGIKKKLVDHDGSYGMVPTKAKDGLCIYCGHVAPKMTPVSLGCIRGTHVSTGHEIEFKSIPEARAAGWWRIFEALRDGYVYREYLWKRI